MNINNPFTDQDFFPELTPLIDVMFLLLVFFMLTTTFERENTRNSIKVDLPHAQQSSPVSKASAVDLQVNRAGDYLLEGKPCEREALADALKISVMLAQDSLVVISADAHAPYHSIIFIYDVLQALGIRQFSHEVK